MKSRRNSNTRNTRTTRKPAPNSTGGCSLFQQEDFPGAIEVFSRAVELNPKFVEAIRTFAASHFRMEAYDKAIEAAKKALELMPDSSQTIKLISVAYSAMGDEKTALEYQEKLKDLPDAEFSPEELYNMGVVEANEGRDTAAVDYFKKAVEIEAGPGHRLLPARAEPISG